MALHLFCGLILLRFRLPLLLQAIILTGLSIKFGQSYVINWEQLVQYSRIDCLAGWPGSEGHEQACRDRGCIWEVRRPLETAPLQRSEGNAQSLTLSSRLLVLALAEQLPKHPLVLLP